MKKVLVTGGAGYIGSHTVVELINAGYEPIIVDNLVNSKEMVLDRIKMITGIKPKFYKIDLCDKEALEEVFEKEEFNDVIHFAGLKAVGESCRLPLKYYQNNIDSTLNLLELMIKHDVKNIVFSSSATVYGTPKHVPLKEDDDIGVTTNTYVTTKLIIEGILGDVQKVNPQMNVVILRYFNPIGAHKSGLIGEDPNGIPNNLMPYITQVAVGKLKELGVFGDDYNTPDGTGVRDYIHVVDLALGHVASLKKMEENKGLLIYNLGTGKGSSVLDMVHAFEEANGIKIPYAIKPRRPGDVDANYADCDKAYKEMGWKAKYNIVDACKDSWNWQSHNKNGYEE